MAVCAGDGFDEDPSLHWPTANIKRCISYKNSGQSAGGQGNQKEESAESDGADTLLFGPWVAAASGGGRTLFQLASSRNSIVIRVQSNQLGGTELRNDPVTITTT